jgi:hypothetical protein
LIIFNRFTQGLSLFSWVELKCVGRDYHHSLDSCCPLLRQRALKETETPCVACRDNITQTVFACFYRAKKYIRQVTGENHDEYATSMHHDEPLFSSLVASITIRITIKQTTMMSL